MAQFSNLKSSLAFRDLSQTKSQEFVNSDQQNLKDLNIIYRKLIDRGGNYSKDILKYFDEHYSLENGQNHHKAVRHNHSHQSKRAHKHKGESNSESNALKKVSEDDKSQNASQRAPKESIQKSEAQAKINGQDQNKLLAIDQQKSEYQKVKDEILNIQVSKNETEENKKNTNKFWQYFHHSTNQLVKHQNLTQDQQIYHPSDQELENKYFLEQISEIQNWNQKIKGKQDFENDVSKWNCSTLVENIHTGDYFISQCCFEEVQSHQSNPSCFISSQLWKYNFKAQKFQIQTKFLIDVMHGIEEHSLLSNKILTVQENQFCYIKNKICQNDNSLKKSLQLIHNKLQMPSNFEFLKTDRKSYSDAYSRQLLDNFSIDLPEDWPYELNELEYSFIQNSYFQIFLEKNFNPTKFLKEQFVLIRSVVKKDQKQNKKPSGFLIYSLDDTSTPVVRYQNGEFEEFYLNFFTIIDDNQTIFTLKSKHTVYQITYDKNNGPVKAKKRSKKKDAYDIHQDSRIQIQKEEEEHHDNDPNEQEDQNFAQNLVIPLEMEIEDEDDVLGGKFSQLYYIENDGDIKLIYPYHFQAHSHFDDHHNDHHNISGQKKEHQRQSWIIQQIKRNIGFLENERLGVSIHFNENGVEIHQIKRDMIQYLEMEQKPKKDVVQIIYCTSDIILCLCKNFENDNVNQAIHSFSIKNSCFKENFNLSCSQIYEESDSFTITSTQRFSEQAFQTQKEIEQPKKILPPKSDNRIQLLDKILLEFDWQYNYKKNFQLNLFAQDKKEISNQDSFYLNKRKRGIFFTHNTAIVGNQEFVFDEKYLLLDLYEEDQKQREPIKLVKLFDDDLKDLKLLKYHVSNKCVIFFIRHIAKKEIDKNGNKKQVEQNTDIGIEFFVIRTISQLRLMSMLNEPLLQEDSIIFIPFSLKKILKEKYGEQMKFKKLLQMQSKMEISTHKLTFETVVDHSDPTSQWFPFIYHNKVEDSKYDHYFCFLNIEDICDKLHEQGLDQVYDEINFAQFMQVFKISYYQNENESYQFKKVKETNDSYRNHNHSAKVGGISMFSRCSNWQKDTFEIDNEGKSFFSVKINEQYSARYQIGINLIFDDLQVVEIQEYIVTIDCREKFFFNRDQPSVQKIEKIEKQKNNSYIQILPMQQIYLLKSQKYKDYQKQLQTDFFQKERIIPKISNDGNIEGSMIILNQSQSMNGVFQLTERIEVVNKYASNEQKQILTQKLGEFIFVKVKSKDTFSGYFSDGVFVKNIKYQLIKEYENQLVLNSDCLGKLKIKQDQLFLKLKKCNYQMYWYNLIDLSDQYNQDDLLQPIFGPLTRQSIKRLSFNNQLNNQIFMCQTAFTKQSILNKHFDKDESIYWLYFFSKFLISMSLPNFDEIIFEKNKERIKRYFQPRYILMGKSFSHLDLQYNATNILNLQASFIFRSKENQQHIFLENSPIYQCLKNGNLQKLNSIVKCMGMEKYYDLQYNYLINETILQKAIDQNKFKAVTFIVDYILNNGDEQELCSVLTQDLPQMLLQGKVDLNNFLDLSYEEEKVLDYVINMVKFGVSKQNEALLFNLEQILLDEQLPIFGGEEPTMKLINYEHPFFSKTHLCEIIYKESSQNQEQEQDEVSDPVEEDSGNDGLVQIQFSYIDFSPIIRKIKFDKIVERQGCESNGTKYLDMIQEKIKDIKHVDDLFISSIINEGAVLNPTIIEQSTIKRIVELQYARVRPLVKMELYVYIIFFCVPFIYNIYQYGNTHDDKDAQINNLVIFVNYLICLLTQLLFIVFELADIKLNGFKSYISNGWNVFDSSQFMTFLIHVSLRIIYDLKSEHGLFKIFDNLLQILILLQATIKILQFMRFHDDFSFLVSMITHVFIDLIPFLTVFSMYVFLFSIVNIIMEADFDDGDYQELPRFLRILIQSFRNSIGDLAVIQYGAWSESSSEGTNWIAKPIAIAIIWIFWFFNLLGMLIILTNLLISQVGNTYSTVLEQGTQFLYLQKAELNQHIFTIEEFFGYKNQYKIMLFQQPKDEFVQNEADKQWEEIKNLLQNNRKSIDEVKGDMQKMQQILKVDSEKQIEVITEKIDTLQEKMDEIFKELKDQKLSSVVQDQNKLLIQSQVSENVEMIPQAQQIVENKKEAASYSIFSLPQLFQGNVNEVKVNNLVQQANKQSYNDQIKIINSKEIKEYNINGRMNQKESLLNVDFENDIEKLEFEATLQKKTKDDNRNSFEEFLVNQDELSRQENMESQVYKINESIGKKQASSNQQVFSQFSSINQRTQQFFNASNQGLYSPSQSIFKTANDRNQSNSFQRFKIEDGDKLSQISQISNLQQNKVNQMNTPVKYSKNIFTNKQSESSSKRGKSQGFMYN